MNNEQLRLLRAIDSAGGLIEWQKALEQFDADEKRLKEVVRFSRDWIEQQGFGDARPNLVITEEGKRLARLEMDWSESSLKGPLLIFTALDFEREELEKRWNLTHIYPDLAWEGRIDGEIPVSVLPAHGAGRVRAAIQTLDYLNRTERVPDLVIVLGICGGFAETNKVDTGDVINATTVADLATRKMRSGPDGDFPEFRLEAFTADDRFTQVLQSGSFNHGDWEFLARDGYPPGKVPALRNGTLVCVDEVVSSNEWRSNLLEAWPQALGVEMEAGGVMAACHRKKVPVAVVRGVSDLANPLKADDEWRRLSLKAATLVVEKAVRVLVPATTYRV